MTSPKYKDKEPEKAMRVEIKLAPEDETKVSKNWFSRLAEGIVIGIRTLRKFNLELKGPFCGGKINLEWRETDPATESEIQEVTQKATEYHDQSVTHDKEKTEDVVVNQLAELHDRPTNPSHIQREIYDLLEEFRSLGYNVKINDQDLDPEEKDEE